MRPLKLLLVLLPAAAGCNGKGAFALDPKTAADRVAVKRLNQRFLSAEIEHVELAQIIEFLRDASDVNIYVHWAALKANGLNRSTPVNLDVRDATPYEAVITLLGSLESEEPMTCVLADGVVLISTPENAERIAGFIRARPPVKTIEERVAARRMNETIHELNFDDVELEDVIQFIRDVAGVGISVHWSRLERVGLHKNTRVNMRLEEVTLHEALVLCLADAAGENAVGYIIKEGRIHVSTPEGLKKLREAPSRPQIAPGNQ